MSPAGKRVLVAVISCLLFLPAPLLASWPSPTFAWLQLSLAGVSLANWLTVLLLLLFVLLTWFGLSLVASRRR
jgi:multisubunit Na+/H+ antiporter MnhB subunit